MNASNPAALKAATQHIAGWLAQLADLTRAGSEPVTKDKLATYAALLAEDYPTKAFTTASLRHAAFGQEYFPAYDPLRKRVAEWWRDNKPKPLAIVDEALAHLNDNDMVWLRYWHERAQQGFPPIEGRPDVRDVKAHCASLVRQQSRAAWAVIERGENAA